MRRLAEIPLETINLQDLVIVQDEHVLTANVGGGTELGGHLRVHRDHHFLLGAHNGISFLDLVVHPLLEAIAQNYSTYIDYPLLRDLRKVDVVRKVIGDVGLVAYELKDLLEGKVLVLRYIDGLNLVSLDPELLPVDKVLHEVDGRVICKCNDISIEEKKNLPYGGK